MIDKITITIATQKSRQSSLLETLASLEMNTLRPDCIRIYANDYDINCNAGIYEGFKRPLGDLADNGKFFEAEKLSGIILPCDDDLIYPIDYIERIVKGIETNGRKAVVGFHGVTINPTPVNHYYQDRKILRCLAECGEDTLVHLLGTGALGYHADTLKVSLDNFPSPYMADIHFGINAQKQDIPMLCLAHESNWLQSTIASSETHKDSIYAKFRRNDSEQTERVNAVNWKINTLQLI